MNKDDAVIIQLWKEAAMKPSCEPFEDKYGNVRWFNERGVMHRTDGPAVVKPNGTKKWFIDGMLHRMDGPAVEYANGMRLWFIANNAYDDVYDWAEAALKWQGNENPSEDDVEAKVQETMAKDVLS